MKFMNKNTKIQVYFSYLQQQYIVGQTLFIFFTYIYSVFYLDVLEYT